MQLMGVKMSYSGIIIMYKAAITGFSSISIQEM
jgi:hypothetical protein